MKLISYNEDYATIELNGKEVQRRVYFEKGANCIYIKQERIFLDNLDNTPKVEKPTFHINERFDMLSNFTNMALNGLVNSTLITGQGGLGKSYTVLAELEKAQMVDGRDYIIIKGHSTAKALYATLYENRDKVIIFDDCDSILKDTIALNILKGALDTYDVRTISWLSMGFIDDGLPNSFEFRGQVIFISNLHIDKVDQAVKSRAIAVDVSMSNSEKIDRIESIAHAILPEYSMIVKENVLNFVREYIDMADAFNIRTFQTILKIHDQYNGNNWETPAKYVMMNS